MKRKLIVFLIIITVIVGTVVGVIYYQGIGRKSISKTLSAEAQAYLKDKDHSKSLREVNVSDNQAQTAPVIYGKKDTMNDCFNFIIPFTIDNHHHEGDCNEYFSLTNPKGTIYANEVVTSAVSLNDLSDVAMRRATPETYEESHLNAGGRDFLVFKNKDEGFQKTAFYFTGTKVFNITFSSDNVPETETKFQAILASLQLL